MLNCVTGNSGPHTGDHCYPRHNLTLDPMGWHSSGNEFFKIESRVTELPSTWYATVLKCTETYGIMSKLTARMVRVCDATWLIGQGVVTLKSKKKRQCIKTENKRQLLL